MAAAKKLPKIFWLLIGLSLLIFFVLIIGIIFESDIDWRALFKRDKKSSENIEKGTDKTCKAIKSGRIISASSEGKRPQILEWNLKKEERQFWIYWSDGSLSLFDLSFEANWEPKAIETKNFKIYCEKDQKINCLANIESLKTDLDDARVALFDSFIGVWNMGSGAKNSLMGFEIINDDQLKLKSFVGLCNKPPTSHLKTTTLQLFARNYLLLSESQLGLFGIYDIASLSEPIPLGALPFPPWMYTIANTAQVLPYSCKAPNSGSRIVDIDSNGKYVLFVQDDRNQQQSHVWLSEWTGDRLKNKVWELNPKEVKSSISRARFIHPQYLALTGQSWIGKQSPVFILKIDESGQANTIMNFKSSSEAEIVSARTAKLKDLYGRLRGEIPQESMKFLVVEEQGFIRKRMQMKLVGTSETIALPSTSQNFNDKKVGKLLWDYLPAQRHLMLFNTQDHSAIHYKMFQCN